MDSFCNFNFDLDKTRKGILRYVILRNLPYNLVKESEIEEIVSDAFSPNLQYFPY